MFFHACFIVVSINQACAELLRKGARFFAALAWGVGRRSDVIELIRHRWDVDRVMKDEAFVLSGLVPWEEKLYEACLPIDSHVGLIGCGGGRDVIGLARKGHRVDGVDLSSDMIEAAEEYVSKAGVGATLYCADIFDFEFSGDCYDAFIFSNYTYILIPGSARRIEALAKLRKKLSPDGRVIIFYFNDRPSASSQLNNVASWVARVTRNPDLPEAGDEFSPYRDYQHHFTHEEMTNEIRKAGYAIDERCPLMGSDGFAVVLKSSQGSCKKRVDGEKVRR